MANGGVIGRVIQVNKNTAKVSLLSSSKGIENKIPVRLGNAEETTYGLLTGYDSQQNAYIITQLTTQDKISKGTQVFTSGLGGDSPRDLLIGTVLGEKDDNQGLNRQIYVKPASNLYDIRFVFVIQRMIGGN
nr:rod shape-determining protein MreC [Lactococcus allomyrinae]